MNKKQWGYFFYYSHAILEESPPGTRINVFDFPTSRFPVSDLLCDYTTIEILLLAYIIISKRNQDWDYEPRQYYELKELFQTDYYLSDKEFQNSFYKLLFSDLIQVAINDHSEIILEANNEKLYQTGLLSTLWDLSDLGLFHKICEN